MLSYPTSSERRGVKIKSEKRALETVPGDAGRVVDISDISLESGSRRKRRAYVVLASSPQPTEGVSCMNKTKAVGCLWQAPSAGCPPARTTCAQPWN